MGRQIKTAQINTITVGGTDAAAQAYSATMNGKTITFTSTGGGNVADAAGLLALLQASTEPEFLEATYAAQTTLIISATAKTAGYPFTLTSASSGTGTCVSATTVANTSPSDINDPVNYSGGSLPTTGDTLIFDNSANAPALWNLSSLSGVTLAALYIDQSFIYTIGLPVLNANGSPYAEYRPQYFAISATSCVIGRGVGNGSGRIKLNFGSNATTTLVLNSGSGLDTPLEPILLLGTNASNILTIDGGQVVTCAYSAEVSTWATVNVAPGGGNAGAATPSFRAGIGATLTTVVQNGGTLLVYAAATTVTQYSGTATWYVGSITTLKVSGSFAYLGVGTLGTVALNTGGTLDFSLDPSGRTITTLTQAGGSTLNDPAASVTFTNAIVAAGCDLSSDCSNSFGKGRALKPS